ALVQPREGRSIDRRARGRYREYRRLALPGCRANLRQHGGAHRRQHRPRYGLRLHAGTMAAQQYGDDVPDHGRRPSVALAATDWRPCRQIPWL
ncbi:hypothetical protein, partial [Pseudomonas sp. FEN]